MQIYPINIYFRAVCLAKKIILQTSTEDAIHDNTKKNEDKLWRITHKNLSDSLKIRLSLITSCERGNYWVCLKASPLFPVLPEPLAFLPQTGQVHLGL